MDREFFSKNLNKLKKDINEGEMIILSSGKEITFSCDTTYRFRVNKNFYYYLGYPFDNVTYVILKKDNSLKEYIFFDEVPADRVRWIGDKLKKDDVKKDLSLKDDEILKSEKLIPILEKELASKKLKTVYLSINGDKEDMSYRDNWIFKELDNDKVEFKNVDEKTASHRAFKEKEEIDAIRKAISITEKAFKMAARNIKSCKTENEIEAYLDFEIRKEGVRHNGFEPIIASGMNATTLHYEENNSKIEKDSLVLFDIGYEWDGYSSDVSRTIPSSGHYSKKQREIYEIVLKANRKVAEKAKAGMTFKELNDIAKQQLSLGLFNLGLIKSDEDLSEYYFHSVSHPLGLDAHDLRPNLNTIENGMVITDEPGLYIKELGIGIRIEDDLLITPEGNVILTEKIPKEIDEIENLINH